MPTGAVTVSMPQAAKPRVRKEADGQPVGRHADGHASTCEGMCMSWVIWLPCLNLVTCRISECQDIAVKPPVRNSPHVLNTRCCSLQGLALQEICSLTIEVRFPSSISLAQAPSSHGREAVGSCPLRHLAYATPRLTSTTSDRNWLVASWSDGAALVVVAVVATKALL